MNTYYKSKEVEHCCCWGMAIFKMKGKEQNTNTDEIVIECDQNLVDFILESLNKAK